jgi:hypothetical protein
MIFFRHVGNASVLAMLTLLGVFAPASVAQETPAAPAAPPQSAAVSETPAKSEKIEVERQPYRISVHLTCDPSARYNAARRARLIADWQTLVRRLIGAPWVVTVAAPDDPLSGLDALNASPDAFQSGGPFDTIWLIRLIGDPAGSGLVVEGRAYDAGTRKLGPFRREVIASRVDVARGLFRFTHALFSPTAQIVGQEGGRALLSVRGAAVMPATPEGAVVAPGMIFQPLRLVTAKSGAIVVNRIDDTYLQVESVDASVTRCLVVTGRRDPFTNRIPLPFTLAAVGVKTGSSPTRLRFVIWPEEKSRRTPAKKVEWIPAAGYTLTVRTLPNGQPREAGLTDRTGRIVLQPGFADGLVSVRLLAGNVEPMIEFPVMPGISDDEALIPIEPRPLTMALEAELDSLKDEIVDLIALRGAVERIMKARLEGEDWDGLAEAIKQFARFKPRDEFNKALTKIKEEAARKQAEIKKPILTATAQAQLSDVQNLIDRYLDDDAYNAYVEALDKGRKEIEEKQKAAEKLAAKSAATKAAAEKALANPAPAANPPAPVMRGPGNPGNPGGQGGSRPPALGMPPPQNGTPPQRGPS